MFGSSTLAKLAKEEICGGVTSMSLRGAVARHTDKPLLSASARVAFTTHIQSLLAENRRDEALELWGQVFEVVHRPYPMGEILDVPTMPPMRTLVCTRSGCMRCLRDAGGFYFPWIGPWCYRRTMVSPGEEPSQAWQNLHHDQERMDLLLVAMYASQWELRDFCPVIWDQVLARVSEEPGCARLSEVREQWRRWQVGQELWRDPGAVALPRYSAAIRSPLAGAHRAMHGWISLVASGSTECLPKSCLACGTLTRHTCSHCLSGLCIDCDVNFPRYMCCMEFYAMGTPRLTLPAVYPGDPRGSVLRHLLELARPTPEMVGPESEESEETMGDVWGDANPAALPLAGWQAVDAIQQVEDQRIQAWRKDNGLTLDEDFAFAFTTYEQAQVMAGGLVADRWVAVRSAASDSMLQEVSAAIHDMRAAPAQPMRRPAPKFKARRPGVRLRPNAEDSPEVVTKRVDALAAIWVTCQVLRPRGRMSVELQASWDESCRRLAQRQVAHAEAVTISNVIKTFHELKAVLDSRGRPLPPEEVDIDHFLYHGTTAPSRALAALKWIVKNGDLGWPLYIMQTSPPQCPGSVYVPKRRWWPLLLGHLEDTIVGCCGINDPEWLCLMGSWMVAVECSDTGTWSGQHPGK